MSLACLRKLLQSRGPPMPLRRPLGPPVGLLCLLFSTDDIMITEWLSEMMLSVCPLLQLEGKCERQRYLLENFVQKMEMKRMTRQIFQIIHASIVHYNITCLRIELLKILAIERT